MRLLVLFALLYAMTAQVCSPSMNNPGVYFAFGAFALHILSPFHVAHDLNGGPVMMATADPALCRQLCEDHEGCGAFVFHPRSNGCLPPNVNTNHSNTNLPRE
jgi:hypothetical protein